MKWDIHIYLLQTYMGQSQFSRLTLMQMLTLTLAITQTLNPLPKCNSLKLYLSIQNSLESVC